MCVVVGYYVFLLRQLWQVQHDAPPAFLSVLRTALPLISHPNHSEQDDFQNVVPSRVPRAAVLRILIHRRLRKSRVIRVYR